MADGFTKKTTTKKDLLGLKVDMQRRKEILAVYYKDKSIASSSAEEGRQTSLWALICILSPKSFER